jgi:hypothetical protein
MKEESHGSRVLYQVVIESSGVLLSIRGVRVTTNKVVLLVVYPSATQARQVLVSGSRSDPSPRGAAFRVKKRPKPERCCFQGQEGYRQF